MTREQMFSAAHWVATVSVPVCWIIALVFYQKTFNALRRELNAMNAQLMSIWTFLTMGKLAFDERMLPTNCIHCGAVLQGGATQHKEGCEIRKLIKERLPPVQ